MNLADIAELRMFSQQFSGVKIHSAVELIKWFGAIQGQEYALTKWSIGSRIKELKDSEIENNLNDGVILRLHILRPTWHFIAADDVKWMLKLTAHRVKAQNASFMRKISLDNTLVKKCLMILIKSLKDKNYLTRNEINAKFKEKNIFIEGHALAYVMMDAELNGIICSGPRKGNQFTYALLEERSKRPVEYSKEEALSVFTNRYFRSRGPATVHDFSVWSGLTVAECKRGIEINKSTLLKMSLSNKDYYMSEPAPGKSRKIQETFLLPPYDEYIMGYKDRSASFIFKEETGYADFPSNFVSMILKNGQIVGSWRRVPGKKAIELEYNLFRRGYPKQEEIEHTIKRFSEFYALPVHTHETAYVPVFQPILQSNIFHNS